MGITVEAAVRGREWIWGAPTYDQCRVAMDETMRAASGVFDFNASRMEAKAPSGGRIYYRSLDNPDNARGRTADGVVIDEAGDVAPEAWYEVLRPMLLDTKGDAWLIGTPKGLNWFYDEFENALKREDSMAWQAPTLGVKIDKDGRLVRVPHPLENPNIDFEEIAQIYESTPLESFQQEILAEFIADSGAVFRRVKEAATATAQEKAKEHHVYCIGVDLAKSKDFTVISVIDCTTREFVHLDRFNQVDYLFQVDRIRATCERFKPEIVIVEENANEALIELLRTLTYWNGQKNDYMPIQAFRTVNESKAEIVQALALAFERQEIRILNDRQLIRELLAFQREKLEISGQTRYAAPEGQHDDCVMSLCLAWYRARRIAAAERYTPHESANRKLIQYGFPEPAVRGQEAVPFELQARIDTMRRKEVDAATRPLRYGWGKEQDDDSEHIDRGF